MIEKIKKFFSEVLIELKKVSWSNRAELISSTWIVIISAAFLGLYIGLSDFVLSRLLALIIR